MRLFLTCVTHRLAASPFKSAPSEGGGFLSVSFTSSVLNNHLSQESKQALSQLLLLQLLLGLIDFVPSCLAQVCAKQAHNKGKNTQRLGSILCTRCCRGHVYRFKAINPRDNLIGEGRLSSSLIRG